MQTPADADSQPSLSCPAEHAEQLVQGVAHFPASLLNLPSGQASQRPLSAPPQSLRCLPAGHDLHGAQVSSHVAVHSLNRPSVQLLHTPRAALPQFSSSWPLGQAWHAVALMFHRDDTADAALNVPLATAMHSPASFCGTSVPHACRTNPCPQGSHARHTASKGKSSTPLVLYWPLAHSSHVPGDLPPQLRRLRPAGQPLQGRQEAKSENISSLKRPVSHALHFPALKRPQSCMLWPAGQGPHFLHLPSS